MTTTRQLRFVVPQEQELYNLEVRTGIDAGVWQVDRQLVRTPSNIFIPYRGDLTGIQTYNTLQNDPALLEAGFELAPVTVLLYGIQHDKDFYEMLINTTQLTGSGVVGSHLLGTPNVTRDGDLQYQGLRNDRPIARIEPQHGQVRRLDKTTLWGISKNKRVGSESAMYHTNIFNDDGNRFVMLGVTPFNVSVYANLHPLDQGFLAHARLAKKIE